MKQMYIFLSGIPLFNKEIALLSKEIFSDMI